jgi:hypothetical protein
MLLSQKCIAVPNATPVASLMASLNVGCAQPEGHVNYDANYELAASSSRGSVSPSSSANRA